DGAAAGPVDGAGAAADSVEFTDPGAARGGEGAGATERNAGCPDRARGGVVLAGGRADPRPGDGAAGDRRPGSGVRAGPAAGPRGAGGDGGGDPGRGRVRPRAADGPRL